jgi:cytochrome c oxidase subunit 4
MTEPLPHSEHRHPGVSTYLTVAGVLTVITLVEVGVFYVPTFHPVLAPILLTLSALKFSLVVMFYMHLKSDHRLFAMLFSVPLLIAVAVGVSLLFLFGVFTAGA